MNYQYHKTFKKVFRKSPAKIQRKFFVIMTVFEKSPHERSLNNHALIGKYLGYRSLDITGDWRVIFETINVDTVKLVNIGTHSQLYG